MFNLDKLKNGIKSNDRYDRRILDLSNKNLEVENIKNVVNNAVANINEGQKSFIIYGEPQSGKTEMMIALTAKILDMGHKLVIILLNDSVQLLSQNLERFQRAGLSPAPKKFNEIMPKEIKIGNNQWVIFCKKNSKDLQNLLGKIEGHSSRVIIDDEADYATPNSRINRQEKSKINKLTGYLIGDDGIYIGVTATPARLDLNRTHKNQNEFWIDFAPHSCYTGKDLFFPVQIDGIKYSLKFLPDTGDYPNHLREAFFSFMANVAYLNISNEKEENYSILVHTSGKKADHSIDYGYIVKTFEALKEDTNKYHEKYLNRIWDIANERYPSHADNITRYIIANIDRHNIVVMNSDKEKNAAENKLATIPATPFTVIIGGNIISRGVTFENLLSMFFTRDVRHKLQQDTYIQRARMFGSRGKYLKYFELTIPKQLYLDWQKCFIFHRLSLESRKQNNRIPVWLDGERIAAVSSSSIDQSNVLIDKGEMSFKIFDFEGNRSAVEGIINNKTGQIDKIRTLSNLLGENCLPIYLVNYIESYCPEGNKSIAIHLPASISGYTNKDNSMNKESITRTKGFIGNNQMEPGKYRKAIHHINIFYNDSGKARVFYKYNGNIRFLKTQKKQ